MSRETGQQNREAGAVSLDGVGKSFAVTGGSLTVLEDITFSVRPQSVVALLGASGCGKSTLLNLVAGLLRPDTGTIRYGQGSSDGDAAGTGIGYLFQEDRLLPWRSARANVEFALEAGRVPRAERRARAGAALELVGLSGFADAFPHQLSGGMRSRVALARSLVTEPSLLLMDEPFSRLDAQTRAQMHTELLRIHALKGMTLLFVTHDVEEAVVLADEVVVLSPRPGRVREIFPVTCARPRDPTARDSVAAIQHLRALL